MWRLKGRNLRANSSRRIHTLYGGIAGPQLKLQCDIRCWEYLIPRVESVTIHHFICVQVSPVHERNNSHWMIQWHDTAGQERVDLPEIKHDIVSLSLSPREREREALNAEGLKSDGPQHFRRNIYTFYQPNKFNRHPRRRPRPGSWDEGGLLWCQQHTVPFSVN